jgi:hypothetical protein
VSVRASTAVNIEPAYLTIADFCRWCGRSRSTVLRDLKRGRYRSIKHDKTRLIVMESARAYFASLTDGRAP